jgi:arsenate reductase
MTEKVYQVLFLCTGNSARSILAEAILNKLGRAQFHAFSAGSDPRGQINPYTLDLLQRLNYDTETLRSKSWQEFARPDAPQFDFIFTVCDTASGESCPIFPGKPATAHWGIPDPAAATGNEAEVALAFKEAYRMLSRRIEAFTALRLDKLDDLALRQRLRDIGGMEGASAGAKTPA